MAGIEMVQTYWKCKKHFDEFYNDAKTATIATTTAKIATGIAIVKSADQARSLKAGASKKTRPTVAL